MELLLMAIGIGLLIIVGVHENRLRRINRLMNSVEQEWRELEELNAHDIREAQERLHHARTQNTLLQKQAD